MLIFSRCCKRTFSPRGGKGGQGLGRCGKWLKRASLGPWPCVQRPQGTWGGEGFPSTQPAPRTWTTFSPTLCLLLLGEAQTQGVPCTATLCRVWPWSSWPREWSFPSGGRLNAIEAWPLLEQASPWVRPPFLKILHAGGRMHPVSPPGCPCSAFLSSHMVTSHRGRQAVNPPPNPTPLNLINLKPGSAGGAGQCDTSVTGLYCLSLPHTWVAPTFRGTCCLAWQHRRGAAHSLVSLAFFLDYLLLGQASALGVRFRIRFGVRVRIKI